MPPGQGYPGPQPRSRPGAVPGARPGARPGGAPAIPGGGGIAPPDPMDGALVEGIDPFEGQRSILNPVDATVMAGRSMKPGATVRQVMEQFGIDVDGPATQLQQLGQQQIDKANPLNKMRAIASQKTQRPSRPPGMPPGMPPGGPPGMPPGGPPGMPQPGAPPLPPGQGTGQQGIGGILERIQQRNGQQGIAGQ